MILECIKELYESSLKIIELHNQLKREIDGQLVEYLKQKYPKIVNVLIGGVIENENGQYNYTEKSIAYFCKEIFGIKTSVANICEKLKVGDPLHVEVQVEDTPFIKFVKNIKEKLADIIYLYNKDFIESFKVEENLNEFFENPKLFVEIVKDFIQNILNILPNYNEESFKIWSLEMLTYRYIIANYPEFKDEQKFEIFCKTFGYEPYFVPDIQNENIRKEYTIYRFKENSIGKNLRELFLYLWKEYLPQYYILKKFIISLPENPKWEFIKMAREKLREIGVGDKPNIIIESSSWDVRGGYRYAKYYIKGCSINEIYTVYVSHKGNPSETINNVNISLISVLDNIMPFVFFFQDLEIKLILEKEGDKWILRIRWV